MRGGQNAIDLTGERSGKLVAVRRAGSNRWRSALWHCDCDCGGFAKVVAHQILSGRIRSCGCERHAVRGEDGRFRRSA